MASANERPVYVVDASVAVKWHLRDEDDVDAADLVLDDFRDGRTELVAPSHFRFEIPSAILNALRRRRLTAEQGRSAISEFLALQISTFDGDPLIAAGFELALRFDCNLYDGVYLALSESVGCPFVFADHHLRNALGGRFAGALWLGDYVSHVRP